MNVADHIANFLSSKGVKTVFELSGGMITLLLDSLHRHGGFSIVSVHHEQSAAFAADASGRISGIPGVALATSGPGATNLLTGIASCYFDSSPAVFITGQVNREEQKRDLKVRQLGFQETDIVAMAAPITKAAWRVEKPEEALNQLEKAFNLAIEGRPGPVLVDLPMDIQKFVLTDSPSTHPQGPPALSPHPVDSFWSDLADALDKSSRPLILAGGGIRSSRARDHLIQFLDTTPLPVVHSLMGVDLLPHNHPLRIGMIGSYGNRWANIALYESDLLLVLGSRLDVRQTGADTDAFSNPRTIYHVDIEDAEMNNRIKGCHTARSDLKTFFSMAKSRFAIPDLSTWKTRIAELKAQWPDTKENPSSTGINPNQLMHLISQIFNDAGAFVADVGQHQMWAAQSLQLHNDQRFLTSGGMGSMGFALPAAIGAAFTEDKPIVVIAGDGGFQCNIQELQTLVRNQLKIRIIVLNNQCHGMVRQFQQSYFGGRYQSTMWGYSAPDFCKVAEAYGIPAKLMSHPSDAAFVLEWAKSIPSGPSLIEVQIDPMTNAFPKIAFGRPISEMEPLATPIAMEST